MDPAIDNTLIRPDSTPPVPPEPTWDSFGPTGSIRPSIAGYEILGELGRGGMGVVYKARQTALNRVVALKMILSGGTAGPEELARFRTEAEVIAHLAHPHLVDVYEVGEWRRGEGSPALPYLVMEYLGGGSLEQRLAGQPQSPQQSAGLVSTLARALHVVHQRGVIHRDLKPANILFAEDGQPRITDFGLARRLEGDSNLTQTGLILGTPVYMSPEQAAGNAHAAGPCADIYALGVILYELLTGEPPFRGANSWQTIDKVINETPVSLRKRRRDVPRDLETICLKCLLKDPGQRYLDARALADDLDNWLAGRPIEARPTPTLERLSMWVRRQPAVASLLGLVAVGLVGFTVSILLYQARLKGALREARDRAAESRQRLVLLVVAHGNRALDEGDASTALLWFVEALRLDEPGSRMERLHRVRIGTLLRQSPQPKRLWLHEGRPTLATFSPDGQHLLTADDRGVARIWDLTRGILPPIEVRHDSPALSASWGPVGFKAVVLGYQDGSVLVHDLVEKRTYPLGDPAGGKRTHAGPVRAVTHAGRQILTASEDGTVRLWNALRRGPGRLIGKQGAILAADWQPGRQLVATGSADRTARLWNVETGRPLTAPLVHPGKVRDVRLSPGGKRLATACDDGGVRIWSVEGKLLVGPLRHRGPVVQVRFAPNGKVLVSASEDHTARVWDVGTGEQASVALMHTSTVNAASFSDDGLWIATASDDNTARVWNARTGEPASPRLRNPGSVGQALFGPLSGEKRRGERFARLLVTTSNEGSVRLWAVCPTQQKLSPVLGHRRDAAQATAAQRWVSPDGRVALTAESNHCARLRDALTNQSIGPPLVHGSKVVSAAFLPNGSRVITGSDDNLARIWSVPTGELLTQPLGHLGTVSYIHCSSDGNLILTASGANRARIWDTETGQPLTPMFSVDSPVRGAAFSADDSRVSVYLSEGKVQTWDLRPETRSLEELECLAALLSGAYVDSRHGVLPLPLARLVELGERLNRR